MLVYGLLGWGLPMFAITGVVAPLLQTPQGELTARHLGEQAVLWGVGGGLCFGLAVWSIAERLYRTHTH